MGRVGKVWLVGAGPGDPGLLTLKGRAVLGRADMVFFDRLVNPGILIWARPGAHLVDVGKEPGGKRTEQPEIGKKLMTAARQGAQVVRLKGGDPFVFGRGGEEAEQLAKAGIPFEIIPGITAGVAAPASEGIPVTHRGLSTELVFRIGARAEGSVRGKTLVGYMAVEGLKEFLENAEEEGFSPETPAALISKGTCRGQRTVLSTVANLAKDSRKARIGAPAIVVVGGVVALRKLVGKQCRGRLAGHRVVLTVSDSLARGWREVFEAEGAEVWQLPMTHIHLATPKRSWGKEIQKAEWIVLTSGAAARALPAAVGDLRKLAGKKIAVVGHSTAEILRPIGLKADFIGRGPGAEALAKSWRGAKTAPVLHLTGNTEEGAFSRILKRKGYSVRRIEVYRNKETPRIPPPLLKAFKNDGADWLVFASGTASERFRRMAPQWRVEPKVAVIGPATARRAKRCGWKVCHVARQVSPVAILAGMIKVQK